MLFGEEHVRKYRETDGADGHDWNGTQALILTTTGRKSGEKRDSALIYGLTGDSPVIVASKGGAPQHPAWYLNLTDNPEVEVQVKGDRFRARARTATGEERGKLWSEMLKHWPQYDSYQTKTDREIPVVVLDRLNRRTSQVILIVAETDTWSRSPTPWSAATVPARVTSDRHDASH